MGRADHDRFDREPGGRDHRRLPVLVRVSGGSTRAGAIVAVKINTTQTTCTNDNSTSGDANFSQVCGTGTYSNNCSGNNICRNGAEVPANTGVCPVTVSGGQVTANAGVTILFAIVHDGQCPGGHFCPPFCGPITSFTANCGSS
jgi:hypothetical protein